MQAAQQSGIGPLYAPSHSHPVVRSALCELKRMTLGHQLSENVLSKYTRAAWSTMNWFKKNKDSGEPGGSDSGALAGQSGPTSIERRRVTEMLVLICEGNYGAIVSNTELDASWRGQFSWAEDDTVALEVELNEVEAVLDPGAFCTVSFTYENHAQVFLTTVKHSELLEDGGLEIDLYIPDAIHAAGRRELYRIPVPLDTDMEVQVISGSGDVAPAMARDINTGGMRIKLEPDAISIADVGEKIEIRLKLGDLTCQRAADVRHKDSRSNCLGLHFLETGDRVEQQQMRQIVREAERQYLLRVNRQD